MLLLHFFLFSHRDPAEHSPDRQLGFVFFENTFNCLVQRQDLPWDTASFYHITVSYKAFTGRLWKYPRSLNKALNGANLGALVLLLWQQHFSAEMCLQTVNTGVRLFDPEFIDRRSKKLLDALNEHRKNSMQHFWARAICDFNKWSGVIWTSLEFCSVLSYEFIVCLNLCD